MASAAASIRPSDSLRMWVWYMPPWEAASEARSVTSDVSAWLPGGYSKPDDSPHAPDSIASRTWRFMAVISPDVGRRASVPMTSRRTCPEPTMSTAFVPMPWRSSLAAWTSIVSCSGHEP